MTDLIDLDALRDSIKDVLAIEAASDRIHRHYDSGDAFDAGLARIAGELGWFGLGVSEEHGGLGTGTAGLAVLYEELGRGPAPIPMISTLTVAEALDVAGTPAQRDTWLQKILTGGLFAAFATDCPLTFDGDGKASGTVQHLVDGAAAGLFLLTDPAGRGILVDRDAVGVSVKAVPLMDRTRSYATLELSQVNAEPIAVEPARLLDHAALAIAADSVGGGAAILERTVEYLKTRTQFGKPIGSFQALKHRIANLRLRQETAHAVLHCALAETDPTKARAFVALAKSTAADNYAMIADDAVQLHGGIGFTWEQDCHLFLKRARTNQLIFGDSERALDQAAALLVEAV